MTVIATQELIVDMITSKETGSSSSSTSKARSVSSQLRDVLLKPTAASGKQFPAGLWLADGVTEVASIKDSIDSMFWDDFDSRNRDKDYAPLQFKVLCQFYSSALYAEDPSSVIGIKAQTDSNIGEELYLDEFGEEAVFDAEVLAEEHANAQKHLKTRKYTAAQKERYTAAIDKAGTTIGGVNYWLKTGEKEIKGKIRHLVRKVQIGTSLRDGYPQQVTAYNRLMNWEINGKPASLHGKFVMMTAEVGFRDPALNARVKAAVYGSSSTSFYTIKPTRKV